MSPVSLFLVFWLRYGRYRWSRLRRLFERRHLSTPLPPAASLQEIEALLHQVTWTPDGPLHLYDAISYPQTTWAKKKDDCDGFAVLAAEMLKRWDPSTSPVLLTVMMHPARKSHTVCAFRDGTAYRFFDNARLNPNAYAGYAEVAQEVGRRGTRVICWDVADPQTLRQSEFHRA